MHVLISGAGIAGPALALCLNRLGMKTTVVEKATTLRAGGQAVDFRGPVHRAALERMHLWDAIHERRTLPQGLELLNTDGSPCATMPSVMMCGDVEILRGDLSQLLYERTRDHSEYRFGERVAELNDRGDHVEVEFERAPAERFDIVIGADGLHSGVRKRIFGSETTALAHHGYRIATFSLENSFGLRENAQVYSQPGRAICLTATARNSARALLIHTGGRFEYEGRDLQAQLPVLRKRFENMGWHAPRVMAAMAHTSDFYADAIATVHLPRYSSGRVALLGDAAYGGTLGGQGTSLAIVGAYVLAGELARDREPHVAFQRYERRMRSYASGCQKGAARAGSFFAPRSALGLRARNAMYALLTSRPLARVFEKLVTQAASDFELPEYSPSLA